MSELTISKCREILEECDEVLKKAEPDSLQARDARRKRNWILFSQIQKKRAGLFILKGGILITKMIHGFLTLRMRTSWVEPNGSTALPSNALDKVQRLG